jgi:hypothetical protein
LALVWLKVGKPQHLNVVGVLVWPARQVTGAGAIEVVAPRVNDKRTDPITGERKAVPLGDPAAVVPQEREGG